MNNEKIKPKLNGTAETMLQCFYARAMHSKNPKNKFHDAKAEELIDRLDYDFSNAKKDTAMFLMNWSVSLFPNIRIAPW